jgi:two-component system, NarL family, nitrate/nitrite response regulator NarL
MPIWRADFCRCPQRALFFTIEVKADGEGGINMSKPDTKPIRIAIIDDHAILVAGLCMLIQAHPEMVVVGKAKNRAEALEIVTSEQPDIILLDLDLGNENGIDFLPELLSRRPKAQVIILTGVRDPDIHHRAVTLGATGLVLKEQAAETLIRAIDRVHAGEVWLDRALMATVINKMSRLDEPRKSDLETAKIATLTHREKEIITLIAQGLNRKQIAEKLFISESTVRNHLTSILTKLGLSDRFELVFYAYRHSLAKPPS